MAMMTPERLLQLAEEASARYERAGLIASPGFQLRLYRRCRGKRARIAPGLYGDVVFWGDDVVPSVVIVKSEDVKRWYNHLLPREADDAGPAAV